MIYVTIKNETSGFNRRIIVRKFMVYDPTGFKYKNYKDSSHPFVHFAVVFVAVWQGNKGRTMGYNRGRMEKYTNDTAYH